MNTPRHWLVIGTGSIARRHMRNLAQLGGDVRITALRRTAGAESAGELGAHEIVGDLARALAHKPEAAIVANPAPMHIADAVVLAQAGVPALIEKPLAESAAAAQPLVEALRRPGAPVMAVGYPLRFLPSLQRCRELLTGGAIGRVLSARFEVGQYLPDWRPGTDYRNSVSARRALGGGVLLELSHEIDYAQWLLGPATQCHAVLERLSDLEIDVEDHAELQLRGTGASGAPWIASLHMDMCQRSPARNCRVVGTEGTLTWDALAGTVRIATASQPEGREAFRAAADERVLMYVEELQAFLQQIQAGTNDLGDAVATLRVIDAARESARTGDTVAVSH